MSYFEIVPEEVICIIAAKVSSSSLADFINLKLSCREFYNVCSEGYVLRYANLARINFGIYYDSPQFRFVHLCEQYGNPEAIYRLSIDRFFRGVENKDQTLERLKIASQSNHLGSFYAIGVILILTGEESLGIQYLGQIKVNKSLAMEVRRLRNEFAEIVGGLWFVGAHEVVRQMPVCCPFSYEHGYKNGWTLEECEEYVVCKACLSQTEIQYIFRYF